MSYRCYILAYQDCRQYAVCRIEREQYGIVLCNLCTCDRTYTLFLNSVAEEHVAFVGGLVVDVDTNAFVYDRVCQPLAFLLGQQRPCPIRCVLSIVLLIRCRNYYTDLVVLVSLEDEQILTCLGRLETYVLVALQPPTGAVAIFHRSLFLISEPSSVGTQYLNYLELVQAVCLKSNRDAQAVTITGLQLYHLSCPIGHRTCNEVMRFGNIEITL